MHKSINITKTLSRGPLPSCIPVDVPGYHLQLCGRQSQIAELLAVVKQYSEKVEEGFLAVHGPVGIGKTSLLAHVLSTRQHLDFLARECNFHIVIWANCAKFRADKFNKRELTAKIGSLARRAASDQSKSLFDFASVLHYFNFQKKRRALFVLDNVNSKDRQVLEYFKGAPCLILTEDNPSSEGFKGHLGNLSYELKPMTNEILATFFSLDLNSKLGQQNFSELVKLCRGNPMLANLLSASFRAEQASGDVAVRALCISYIKLGKKVTLEYMIEAFLAKLTDQQLHQLCVFLFYGWEESVPLADLSILWGLVNPDQALPDLKIYESSNFVFRLEPAFQEQSDRFVLHHLARKVAIEQPRLRNLVATQSQTTGGTLLLGLKLGLAKLPPKRPAIDTDRCLMNTLQKLMAGERLHLTEKIIRKPSLVTYILEKYPDAARLQDSFHRTYLSLASKNGKIESVKLCFEKYPEAVKIADKRYGQLPLHWAVGQNAPFEVVQFLVEKYPEALKVKDTFFGQTPLSLAAEHASFKTIEFLLEKFPEAIQFEDFAGRLPICAASEAGRLKVVQLLYEKYPESIESSLPIRLAAQNGHAEVVKFLHSKFPKGAALVDEEGLTAFDRALMNGHNEVANFLHQ